MSTYLLNDRTYDVAVYCSQGNQLSINQLHAQVTRFPDVGTITMQDMAADISANLAPLMKALMPISAQFQMIGVREMSYQLPPFGRTEYFTLDGGPGTVLSSVLPTQVTGLLEFANTLRGKENQGRMYTPFPSKDDCDNDGHPTAGYRVKLAQLGAQLVIGHTMTIGTDVATYSYGHRPGITGGFVLWDRHWSVPLWATQKRRGDYGKLNRLVFHV